jgi:hypothetical protein
VKLRKQDQEFRNPKVFYPDPKNVDLDRVLVNLFLLLKCDGSRPATRGRQKAEFEKVDVHLEALSSLPGVQGFDEYREIARRWLESDIFDLVNRGRPTEAIASLRPLHLDAHKIRVSKYCRDYNHADALYAMLEYGEQQTLKDLRSYLDLGRNPATRRYDGKSELDVETLTVLKLVEDLPDMYPSGEKVTPYPPTCIGQSRVLCDDVQRLLAYRNDVPRPVMIEYLKTVLGLHLGLYTLRVSRQLPGWITAREAHPTCRQCPVYGHLAAPFAECPYGVSLTVDMGEDYRSRMAQLAQESTSREFERLLDFIKAVFAMNHLLRYAREERLSDDPLDVPSILANPPDMFDADFKAYLKQLVQMNSEDEQVAPEIHAILDSALSPFDMLIELVTHVRQKHHISYLVQMVDKLFQKNTPFGALVQGRSRSNPRRWHLGGRLLEVLVQLAVLRYEEQKGAKKFYTEPILIDDFLTWMERRYGFVIGESSEPNGPRPVTLDEHRAFRDNVRALRNRLREIGFYDDLSDAYNAQTVRPRYRLEGSGSTL